MAGHLPDEAAVPIHKSEIAESVPEVQIGHNRRRPANIGVIALLLAPDVDVRVVYDLLAEDQQVNWFVRPANSSRLTPGEVDNEVRVQAALRVAPRTGAPWKPLLSEFGLPLHLGTAENSEAAALIVRVIDQNGEPRHVLFCFGGLSLSVPSRLTDARFGLIVALNKLCAGESLPPWRDYDAGSRRERRRLGDPAHAVRGVSAEARSGHRHTYDAAAHGPTPVAGLRLDTEADLLRGLHVRTEDSLMRDIRGRRSLRFDTPIEDLDQVEQLADYLVMVRGRSDYRQQWEWIDHLVPVDEGPERDAALDEFARRVVIGDEPHTELAIPPLPDQGEGRVFVGFPGERVKPCRVYPTWSDLARWLRSRAMKGIQIDPLHRDLRWRLEGDETEVVHRVPVIDCLVTEFGHDGKQYVLSEGTLFRVDQDFLAGMDRALEAVPRSSFSFPAYQGGTEKAYNDTAPEASGYRLAELDRTSINLPGQTSVEPCDLVTDDGTLVFVKPKGASSSFSHLGIQAVTAATLYRDVTAARSILLDRVIDATTDDPTHGIAEAVQARLARLENREPRAMSACLLILGRWNGTPSPRSLPLLSRISLRQTVRALEDLGWAVELAMPDAELAMPTRRRAAA